MEKEVAIHLWRRIAQSLPAKGGRNGGGQPEEQLPEVSNHVSAPHQVDSLTNWLRICWLTVCLAHVAQSPLEGSHIYCMASGNASVTGEPIL